ncbi:HNH endonuclease [Patescibacteria group bacterium]|nr:HNH endonuclease [Patescibacteria group bacterium]
MDLWQADHIVERVRGGSHELHNLRTLCVPCHKKETARLAHERKVERWQVKVEREMGEDDPEGPKTPEGWMSLPWEYDDGA